jgi:hypothetical protein
MIDAAGCRGLVRGGAMVSEKHTNFLINTGNATAADLEGLGEEVRRRVFETSGILLEWEIERIGCPLEGVEQIRPVTLSPRWPGGEGSVRGADEALSDAAHPTLPLPAKGRREAFAGARVSHERGL